MSSHVEPCRAMRLPFAWSKWTSTAGWNGEVLRFPVLPGRCSPEMDMKWTCWGQNLGDLLRTPRVRDLWHFENVKMVEMAVYTPKINVSIRLNMVKYWTGSQQVPLGHPCCAAQESLQRVQQVAGDLLKKQKVKSWAWMPWLRRKHCRLSNIDNLENIYIHIYIYTYWWSIDINWYIYIILYSYLFHWYLYFDNWIFYSIDIDDLFS